MNPNLEEIAQGLILLLPPKLSLTEWRTFLKRRSDGRDRVLLSGNFGDQIIDLRFDNKEDAQQVFELISAELVNRAGKPS